MPAQEADDELIERIRERVADPQRRVDIRPTAFEASLEGLGIGELMRMAHAATSDAERAVVEGADAELHARARQIEEQFQRPAEMPLPAPASTAQLDGAEASLGVLLPKLLRRLYAEVANGGFGPGFGLVGVSGGWTMEHGRTLESMYEGMRRSDDSGWPDGLLPIADLGGELACVDAASDEGRVVVWDPDAIYEEPPRSWEASFEERAPSLGDWLTAWLGRPSWPATPEPDSWAARVRELQEAAPDGRIVWSPEMIEAAGGMDALRRAGIADAPWITGKWPRRSDRKPN